MSMFKTDLGKAVPHRPATQEELDAEAQAWGYETWDEFYDAVEEELTRREEEEAASFQLYSEGEVHVPSRQTQEKFNKQGNSVIDGIEDPKG